MKKLALVASAATALVCAASLIATPADAKKHHKKPAAAATGQMAAAPGPGGYYAGPRHENGGPIKSGTMCFKDVDGAHTQAQFGYWEACPKKK